MKGTNATEVAEAHLKDLAIQDQYGVKFLTYWFDEDRGTTFCLVDAPDKDPVEPPRNGAATPSAREVPQPVVLAEPSA